MTSSRITVPAMPDDRPKVVAATTTFNVASFIGRWLAAIDDLVDEIVVIDDGSDDGTLDLLAAHPKVTVLLRKRRGKRTEVRDLNRLMRAAIDRGADWILRLDADEVFDVRMRERIDELIRAPAVGEYRFKKMWLWRGEDQIRIDRPEKFAQWNSSRFLRVHPALRFRLPDGAPWRRVAKVAIRHTRWRPQYGHGGAVVAGPVVDVDDVVIVHYAAADYHDMLRKHIRYALAERAEHPRRPLDDVVVWSTMLLDESTLETAPVPAEWQLDRVVPPIAERR